MGHNTTPLGRLADQLQDAVRDRLGAQHRSARIDESDLMDLLDTFIACEHAVWIATHPRAPR